MENAIIINSQNPEQQTAAHGLIANPRFVQYDIVTVGMKNYVHKLGWGICYVSVPTILDSLTH